VRIAVLSDIHGNLVALDAVLHDVEAQAPDEIWCAGDLGWGGPWASECIAAVRDQGWTTIMGNTDRWIIGDPQAVDDPAQRSEFEAIARAHDISSEDARWLLELPQSYSGAGSLLMVHGTPESPFDAPMPDAPGADFAVYEGRAALVIYGHVHRAFTRRLRDGSLVTNPGSVGFPMDQPTSSYLLVDRSGPDLSLRHRRVEFDRQACVDAALSLGGPVGELCLRNLSQT
jgi:putative phosphoesterase